MAMASSSSPALSLSPWSMTSLRSSLPSIPTLRIPSLRFSVPSSFPSSSRLRSSRKEHKLLRSFNGLAPETPLLSMGSYGVSFENGFNIIDSGSRFYAMRHGKRVPKLNRPPDQRRALLRCLTTQLLKHGRIKTTRARASAMRKACLATFDQQILQIFLFYWGFRTNVSLTFLSSCHHLFEKSLKVNR
ncbi:hypothetical protein J5N97_014635 [Dioscorea zingiberensis]|uniref:Uncharacterized protein n=1 Tax=Dioscorea zingiberensis TaxID=325984 RepID=A0A9D5CSU7_9LILI|nr:hypothetical protein J5N97_014635 [Dioscorea zingiberensis]